MDVQVYENLSEEAKDRLYLETLKRTVNLSGGKKDPETLRREAICEALDSLVETSPMPAAKVLTLLSCVGLLGPWVGHENHHWEAGHWAAQCREQKCRR